MHMDAGTGPQRVQIQTQSGCNGRCVYCPNHEVLHSNLKQGRMDEGLYRKIIDELAELEPNRISLYLMNEPLLDRRLPDFVRYASERVPGATTLVTTNGTYLDEDRTAALMEAGLKRLKVSLQSLDPAVNRELMGSWCDSEKIVSNILGAKRVIDRAPGRPLDLRVSTIVTRLNAHEIDGARHFWAAHGIRLVTSSLENRGGNIEEAPTLNPHAMKERGHDCIRPSREMCILFNGDVVLCCVDWFRTEVLGNVAEQGIRGIWGSPRLQAVRHALCTNDKENMPEICVNCTESARPRFHRRGLRRMLSHSAKD